MPYMYNGTRMLCVCASMYTVHEMMMCTIVDTVRCVHVYYVQNMCMCISMYSVRCKYISSLTWA